MGYVNPLEDHRMRVEIELDHMTSGVPLTGKLTIIVWNHDIGLGDKIHGTYHAIFSIEKGIFGIKADPEKGTTGIPMLPDSLDDKLRDVMRAIHDTVNGQSTHYIWNHRG
jgi:hypothetical protein